MRISFLLFLSLLLSTTAFSQNKYKVSLVAFYNVENLFDTINDPNVKDEEFLPNSPRQYNTRIYYDKLDRLATVIESMGTDITPDGPAILGVSEVENINVLEDLVKNKRIKHRNYRPILYDSKYERGVDVGLLYNPKYFTPVHSEPVFIQLPGGSKDAYYTRDVLYVKGVLDGDTIHIMVNHWPSRSGGEVSSLPGRFAAANVVKRVKDSIQQYSPDAKIIIMGDLNDDPVSPSITKILNAKGKKTDVAPQGLFNPWYDMYKKGIGTSPYQDAWGLFDQIIISQAFLDQNQSGYFFKNAIIFNKEFLIQKTGKWRNYSKRTWDGITYNYGYSDHFPVFIVLLKKV
jgi:predicted extracellular nuclease